MTVDLTTTQLLRSRDLAVPQEDETLLEQYWSKMRRLRAEVDETSLADHEVAVTWTAVEEPA